MECHPEYRVARLMRLRELRAARGHAVDPLEVPPPLEKLPWQSAQKQFGIQGADFMGHFGRLLHQSVQKQMRGQVHESTRESDGHGRGAVTKEMPVGAGS